MDGIEHHYVDKIKSVKRKRKSFDPLKVAASHGDYFKKEIDQESGDNHTGKKGKPYVPQFTRIFWK